MEQYLILHYHNTTKTTNQMKKTLYILSFIISISTFAQKETIAFKDGEKLTYRLSYSNFLTAGYATMEVESTTNNNKEAFHVIGKGKTTGMINWFFKVRDNYETYFYKDTFLPYRFIRQIDEGGYTKDKEILFDQEKNQVTVIDNEKKHKKKFNSPGEVQDLLSSLYFMRNKDISNFKKGDEIDLPIFLDQETMQMKLRFLGREVINTKYGKVKTAKFMPLVASGRVFKEKE
ncbi:MAG TPA: DUF3108 domain-containing protein, partial [Bacteroidia bacterium]|nr:DUF3108 domain-containing protein [Bacteroidia bacterium]